MRYILGISGGFRPGNRDGAACLIRDDEIIAAAEEERFVRIKHAPGLIPINAIRYCLQEAGIDISSINLLLYAGISHSDMKDRLKRCLEFNIGFSPPIELIEHHIAHAASTFFVSGFSESNIITMDLSGDSVSTLLAFGEGNKINKIKEFKRPNSIGAFYNVITQYLGFTRQSDEYKVMGLSSYGKPSSNLSWLIDKTTDGYSFNTHSIVNVDGKPFPSVQEPLYSEEFLKQFKSPRKADEKITTYHQDIAASAQERLEDIVLHLLELLYKETGNKNLCIAGGVGLNCVMNSRILGSPWVENIFIQPASGDAGLALGCCLQSASQLGKKFKRMTHAYYGPKYSNEEIEKIIKITKVPYYYHDDISGFVAERISEGKIIGWFQGRMEYGPRALGSRSILADPRQKDMKDKVNLAIKFRESFRPFAPTILSL
ncbi:MAG: carbamoyl transferase [Nitrospinae bacterium]|nr:carbamoyl transferase [Nitrospinota bacterium]